MAKILSLDTSSDFCSVCVCLDGEYVFNGELAPRRHAQLLMPMIADILKRSHCSLSDFDAIAFGAGPGSFTGLRIAAGVTQGLAYGADLPIIPVSTLAALAHKAFLQTELDQVLVALDARMQEIYWAEYHRGVDNVCLEGQERVSAPDQIAASTRGKSHLYGAGSGFLFLEQFSSACQNSIRALDNELVPDAQGVAVIAAHRFDSGGAQPVEQAIPQYLRNEVSWKKLPGRN